MTPTGSTPVGPVPTVDLAVCPRRSDDGYRESSVAAGDGLRYEPGIDGLRAVAVGVVLLFHGGFAWATGGFLGVSVFFTLSGFLITRLLVDEHARTGRIALLSFWSRRLRRLAPASLVCLFGVVVLSSWWSDVLQRDALRLDVWSALTYWPNWRFIAAKQSYAELFAAPSPVLHFWSLAIEEQFYLVYPIIVAVVVRLGRRRPRLALGAVLTLLLAASSIATQLTHDRDLLYYGTHIRAAELLVGALAALAAARIVDVGRRTIGWLGAGAVAAIVALSATATISSAWIYDGRLVLFAGLSALAVIAATVDGPLRRVASARPLVAIGRVSYGLYLFHWPVFLLLDERRVGWGAVPLFALRLAVTTVVTLVSYRLVEQPVRRRQVLVVPRVARLAFAAAVGVVAVTAPLTRPSASAATAATDIPSGIVTFDPPLSTDAPSAANPSTAPSTVMPTTAPATTTTVPPRPPPPTPTTTVVSRPAIVGFAGSDVSVRARLEGIDGIDVRDLLPVGCPLVSEELAAGCPHAREALQRMAAAIAPELTVLTLTAADRAVLADTATPGDRLQLSNELTHKVRAAAEGALTDGGRILVLDTSGLDDATSVGVGQFVLAHPQAVRVDSADLRRTIERALNLSDLAGDPESVVGDGAGVPSVGAAVPTPVSGPPSTTGEVASNAGRTATRPGALKVFVIGDSTSYDLAAALARVDGGLYVVWGGGANCPVVDVDRLGWSDSSEWPMDECPNVATVWPQTIAALRPDAVVVVASLAEQSMHRYPGSDAWRVAGSPEFTAAHDTMMADLLALTAPFGGLVLVADAPPITAGSFAKSDMAGAERVAAWNAQIARWDARWQPVATIPYAAAVARAEQTGSQRDDGVHLNRRAADEVAAELTPIVVAEIEDLRAALSADGCLVPSSGSLDLARCAKTNAASAG